MSHRPNPFAPTPSAFPSDPHVSFSFETLLPDKKDPTMSKQSIDKYLRLKTNESIEERPASSHPDHPNYKPNKRSLSFKKGLKTEQAEVENEHQLQLLQQENEMRIGSITKQYELKLSKQEEYFGLKQWKLNEEIDNLTHQNHLLQEELKRLKNTTRQTHTECSMCGDGAAITHLTKVLQEIEDNHKGCLDNKKEMMKKLDEADSKLAVLENEHQSVYQQNKMLNKQIRALNNQIGKLGQEKEQQEAELAALQQKLKQREEKHELKVQELQKKLTFMQQERSIMLRDDQESVANSKATLQSTHSVLSNIENSLKSSYIRPLSKNSKQNMQPHPAGRSSVSKILQAMESSEKSDMENRMNYRKMSQNIKNPRNSISKIEQLKWKYF